MNDLATQAASFLAKHYPQHLTIEYPCDAANPDDLDRPCGHTAEVEVIAYCKDGDHTEAMRFCLRDVAGVIRGWVTCSQHGTIFSLATAEVLK